MRACEFMAEGRRSKIDHSFQHASPGAILPGNRDQFYDGRTYDAYRIGMLSGMHPDDLDAADIHSWASNMPMYNTYTQAEHDKITRAMKKWDKLSNTQLIRAVVSHLTLTRSVR